MRRKELFDSGEEAFVTRKKRTVDGELDITPLIDVVFLLLIFFMVASTMQGTPDVDVPFAHYGVGVAANASTVITIRRNLFDELAGPEILLGDGLGRSSDLDGVRAYIQEGLTQSRNHVIIKAERDVPHGVVQEVARIVGSVEGVKFNIGVQEKRTSQE